MSGLWFISKTVLMVSVSRNTYHITDYLVEKCKLDRTRVPELVHSRFLLEKILRVVSYLLPQVQTLVKSPLLRERAKPFLSTPTVSVILLNLLLFSL